MGEVVPNESPRSEGLPLTAANFTWHRRAAAERGLATDRHASVSIRTRCPPLWCPHAHIRTSLNAGLVSGSLQPQGEHLILTRRMVLLDLTLPDLQVLSTVWLGCHICHTQGSRSYLPGHSGPLLVFTRLFPSPHGISLDGIVLARCHFLHASWQLL